MCDEASERENQAWLSRRGFAALAGAAGIGLAAETAACAMPPGKLKERDVAIKTPDGVCDAHFAQPAAGSHPAVLVWPDIRGLRPAFREMGRRLAAEGYAVLTINQFYRAAKSPVVSAGESFQDPAVRARLLPMAQALNAGTCARDTQAFVAWLDRQKGVDRKRKIGTTGYCMGGPLVMGAAATRPDRIGAGATFHGGGLATSQPDSPHLRIPVMKARFLIAIADNDDAREPEVKTMLRTAFDTAKLPAEIEVYKGAMHGWCVPDSPVYNKDQAERAWARLLELLRTAL